MRVGQQADGTYRVERFNPLYIPTFDPAQHAYTIGGVPAISVTTVIREAIGGNPFWTQHGRDAGTATHKAIHYYAEGDLDPNSLDPETRPRLDAYIKFCRETDFVPDLIERPLYHPAYRYCGMPDQVQFGRVIIDFKNGAKQPEYGIQLAAYANLLTNPHQYERWCVLLKPDGNYKIETYWKQDLSTDFNYFISFFNTVMWRRENVSSRA